MLVDPTLREWIWGSLIQCFIDGVSPARFDFNLEAVDLFEVQASPSKHLGICRGEHDTRGLSFPQAFL
jgi:hypothetical protein